MKHVNIYVRGICNNCSENQLGRFVAIIEYKGKEKVIYGMDEYTSSNKMILEGLKSAISSLKEGCIIKAHTTTSPGLTKSKGVNKFLSLEIKNLCHERGHILNLLVCRDRQDELIEMLKREPLSPKDKIEHPHYDNLQIEMNI